jgi:hypothetical protein
VSRPRAAWYDPPTAVPRPAPEPEALRDLRLSFEVDVDDSPGPDWFGWPSHSQCVPRTPCPGWARGAPPVSVRRDAPPSPVLAGVVLRSAREWAPGEREALAEAVSEMYRAGMYIENIASHTRHRRQLVMRLLAEAGIDLSTYVSPSRAAQHAEQARLKEERTARVWSLYVDRHSRHAISRMLHIGYAFVRAAVAEMEARLYGSRDTLDASTSEETA